MQLCVLVVGLKWIWLGLCLPCAGAIQKQAAANFAAADGSFAFCTWPEPIVVRATSKLEPPKKGSYETLGGDAYRTSSQCFFGPLCLPPARVLTSLVSLSTANMIRLFILVGVEREVEAAKRQHSALPRLRAGRPCHEGVFRIPPPMGGF